MSLLSPDNALALLPGRAVLRSGGRALEEAVGEGWEGALAGLAGLLKRNRPRGGIRAVLSHHFARVQFLPMPPVRLSAVEMDGWVAANLAERYGPEAASWRAVWQDTPPGRPVPVAVTDAGHLEQLRTLLADAGLRLVAAQPWFAAAWNLHHRHLRGSGWLALLEPGRLALARVESGVPVSLRVGQAGSAPLDDLAALLTRERLNLSAAPGGDLWLASVGITLPAGAAPAGCVVRPLQAGTEASGMLA